jgi:tetratricopeptide (TPR) repeat protein
MEQARRLAQQAIDADPRLAEAHVALAAVIEAYDWNWTAAEAEYRKALELNRWLPAAHLWYGMFLRDQGRLDEALPALRRAAQLEPFSVLTTIKLAHAYMAAGNDEAAVEQALHATELAPRLAMAYVVLASAYSARKMNDQAGAALDRARPLVAGNPHGLALLARAYACRKRREESIEILRQLEALSKIRYVSPFDMGTISLGLGDEKRALDLLEEAYRQRSSGLIFLRSAKFAGMQHASEFESLVLKMHFSG